ncbi:hypothetical protein H0H81_004019 [Sphagnurus paluster]|uniref:AB hydrolase-1 domain-containing protein n=1 Tax=Sphagnurus paluster TaxID=117069 RepID=A0A9P7KHI4_9AGAR|nr:hypothetical protein H0H81_004019 [Sphagnurus paluster]
MALQPTFFVFDSVRDGKGPTLKMTAKRYTSGKSSENSRGLTLILTHCIGSHKEQWEPAIERMFELQRSKPPHQRIREAWSFDWQNHGDAAVLNREALLKRPQGVSVYEWATALAEFLQSPQMRGHRIVGMGHSAGAGAVMLAAKDFPPTNLPYAAIVLIEAAMVTRAVFNSQLEDRMEQMNFAVNATLTRRDTWESRETAAAWLAKRYPWSEWDPRVVRLLAVRSSTSVSQDRADSDRLIAARLTAD